MHPIHTELQKFHDRLLGWFQQNKRDLPWRRNPTPYKTWISEMMLQQTQVKTVLPYFDRWMNELPSLADVHKSSEHKILALWQGLGYYSRARQIKKAAAHMMKNHGGQLPRTLDEMLEVPGIGPYSAGAILSIAFNQKTPAVDGNVLRVFARLFAIEESIDKPAVREKIRGILEEILSEKSPGQMTEALMELGATVCLPQDAACGSCPVSAHCLGFRKGIAARLPARTQKAKIRKVSACAVILQKNGTFFLRKRPEGQIMGGLWEFPEWKISEPGQKSAQKPEAFLAKTLSIPEDKIEFAAAIKRHYTRFAETLSVFRIPKTARIPNAPGWKTAWLTPTKLQTYPLTSAHAKIRRLALQKPV